MALSAVQAAIAHELGDSPTGLALLELAREIERLENLQATTTAVLVFGAETVNITAANQNVPPGYAATGQPVDPFNKGQVPIFGPKAVPVQTISVIGSTAGATNPPGSTCNFVVLANGVPIPGLSASIPIDDGNQHQATVILPSAVDISNSRITVEAEPSSLPMNEAVLNVSISILLSFRHASDVDPF